MTYCVGLTGGIGCGKSTVAVLFARLGAGIVDTDAISHRLTGPHGAAMPAIEAAFGAAYVDASGALDRAAMRKRVFSDPRQKRTLEGILHPLIRDQAKAEAMHSTAPYVLLVVPLLFEASGYTGLVARSLIVDCSEQTQVDRVSQRSRLGADEVRAIIAQQIDRSSRLALADDVIANDGPPSELEPQVARLHQQYLALARGSD
jgi:dephospho-CoA kinase